MVRQSKEGHSWRKEVFSEVCISICTITFCLSNKRETTVRRVEGVVRLTRLEKFFRLPPTRTVVLLFFSDTKDGKARCLFCFGTITLTVCVYVFFVIFSSSLFPSPPPSRKAVLIAANVEEETILGLPSRGRLLSASNFSKEPMPRTLRTVLLGGGGVPPGSAVTGL